MARALEQIPISSCCKTLNRPRIPPRVLVSLTPPPVLLPPPGVLPPIIHEATEPTAWNQTNQNNNETLKHSLQNAKHTKQTLKKAACHYDK